MSQQLAIEAEAFGRSPILVRHSLVDEPRLGLPAIAELASQLPATAEFIDHSLGDLPPLVPGGKSTLPRLNGALRQMGFSPRHVGESELGDRGKAFAARQASRARRLTRSATKLGAHRRSSVGSDGTGTTRVV